MTLDELTEIIQGAQWFANLGRFHEQDGMIPIRTLEAWRSDDTVVDEYHESIALQMQWLENDKASEDSIHGATLKTLAREKGLEEELKARSLAFYKLTLISLRPIPSNPLLKCGPHDFNLPARSAAAYAARMATREIITQRQGFWCSVAQIFSAGNFPCGLLPDGKLVVF